MHSYRAEIPGMSAAGISFIPQVWSSEGRPHPAVKRVLAHAANLVGRRRGCDAKAFHRRWTHAIMVEIVKRQVAMIKAVMPRPSKKEMALMWGDTDGGEARIEDPVGYDHSAGCIVPGLTPCGFWVGPCGADWASHW